MNSGLLKRNPKQTKDVSLFSATALGIGGMMGAGLYSLLAWQARMQVPTCR